MEEFLQELIQFLQSWSSENSILSIIISVLAVILTLIKTRTASIQKKVGMVNLNNFHIKDYVILYDHKIISFEKVVIKKKTDLTKLDLINYSDIGGVLDVKKKNE